MRIHHSEVRSLPPQPAILVFREFPSFDEKGPQNVGFSHRRLFLETGSRTFWAENSQKVSGRIQENSRFLETRLRDRRINPLRGRIGSAFRRFCSLESQQMCAGMRFTGSRSKLFYKRSIILTYLRAFKMAHIENSNYGGNGVSVWLRLTQSGRSSRTNPREGRCEQRQHG
jgi:hypothetical protein